MRNQEAGGLAETTKAARGIEADTGTRGREEQNSPENLPSTVQMPLPVLWDSPHDVGQGCGCQGGLGEHKGAVSKSTLLEAPFRDRLEHSPTCTSVISC